MLEPSEMRQFFPVVVSPSHDRKFFQHFYVASLLNFTVEAERAAMRVRR